MNKRVEDIKRIIYVTEETNKKKEIEIRRT